MYCRDKYDCPLLDEAAKAYMEWAEYQKSVEVVSTIFELALRQHTSRTATTLCCTAYLLRECCLHLNGMLAARIRYI